MNPVRPLNFSFNVQLASKLRDAVLKSGRFVCLHAALGDALLKSSKDFIH